VWWRGLAWTLIAWPLAAAPASAALAPDQQRRLEMGAGWFRGMLTADVDIEKKALPDGRLLVVFIHAGDPRPAQNLAKAFAEGAPIRKRELVAEVASDADLASYTERVPAGLFLVSPSDARLRRAVVEFGRVRRALVYSPFEGDVEEGVPGGLAVEAQVRPFINKRALDASRITLKDLFLQAAKVHP